MKQYLCCYLVDCLFTFRRRSLSNSLARINYTCDSGKSLTVDRLKIYLKPVTNVVVCSSSKAFVLGSRTWRNLDPIPKLSRICSNERLIKIKI